jgi:alpha-L-fucosidase
LEIQLERLKALGKWLEKNGDGIYDTEPWIRAESTTIAGQPVRFTRKNDRLFVFVLGIPNTTSVEIPDLELKPNSKIQILGESNELEWIPMDKTIKISIPSINKAQITLSLSISPIM